MLELPDYIVIDFCQWIFKNYSQRASSFKDILSDEQLMISLANKYLEKIKYSDNYDFIEFKKIIKASLIKTMDNCEVDKALKSHCRNRNCISCSKNIYRDVEKILRESFYKQIESDAITIENIDSYSLVNSLKFYMNRSEITSFPMMHYMVVSDNRDTLHVLDFLNWLSNQKEYNNVYKISKQELKDIIENYQFDRNIHLDFKTKKDITNWIKSLKPQDVNTLLNKSEKKSTKLSYVLNRYYNNVAQYKCIILPLKGETDLKEFIDKYWEDLDYASGDNLDIFYSLEDLKNSGYISKEKIKDLIVDTSSLPCIVLWKNNISLSKNINIRTLTHSDLFQLLTTIIDCIERGMDFQNIYNRAFEKVVELIDKHRTIQNNTINISGTNNGQAIVNNYGEANNIVKQNISQMEEDISFVKKELEKLEELNNDMQKFLEKILDDFLISEKENNKEMKNECKSKLKGFIVGAGKVADKIISIISSVASIASLVR